MGNFKNLRVWKDGLQLATEIYALTRQPSFSKDFGLRDQIQRASVSVSSNIAEGEERSTDKDSIRFLYMANASAAEVITQLHIAYNIGYIKKEELEKLEQFTEKIRSSIKNLIKAKR